MNAQSIVESARSAERIVACEAQRRRSKLATLVKRGLCAEAQLAAEQVAALGPHLAAQLACKRGRDRVQVLAAILKGAQS